MKSGCLALAGAIGITLLVALVAVAQSQPPSASAFAADNKKMAVELTAVKEEKALLEARLLARGLELQKMNLEAAVNVQTAAAGDKAYPNLSSLWNKGHDIPVSWENPSSNNVQERAWVKAAIERTWEEASAVRFTGWGTATPHCHGIRILIADDQPYCERLGRFLDGVTNGMVLNFTFTNWSPVCSFSKQECIEKIAVHEFGHALGFAHEQNRPDAPEECQEKRQGQDGDCRITIYDPESIMNYCNPKWNNNGELSPLDKQAVALLYGPQSP